MDLMTIVTGIGAGVTYGLSTFAKKEKQPFDWNKFGTTVVVGGLAGLGTSLLNIPVETSQMYLIQLGAVPIVENGFKFIWRKIIKKQG